MIRENSATGRPYCFNLACHCGHELEAARAVPLLKPIVIIIATSTATIKRFSLPPML